MWNNIISAISDAVTFLGRLYDDFNPIIKIILGIIAYLVAYRAVYAVIGLLFTRRFEPAKRQHKYAIVIAARNESAVIGNLLDSIAAQDYPKELLTVFVVADNCTDNTAEIVRSKGAKCYERFDDQHKTKGFALQFLFERIEEDYGRSSFEGYFVFDADNLLKRDYISRMNDAFDSGEKIITSYRNTKNFNESWLASTYALHWIRSIRFNHRARSVLRLATNIQGTGFLFSNEIVKNGWKYTSLTEDRALTADAVAQGYRISYNDKAEFFDEQPNKVKIALRQRLRWSKGHLIAFTETGPKLLLNVFFGKLFLKHRWDDTDVEKEKGFKGFLKRFAESMRHRFASFDTLMQLTPFNVFKTAAWLLVSVLLYACFCYSNGMAYEYFFNDGSVIGALLKLLFPIKIGCEPGVKAFFMSVLTAVWWRALFRLRCYITAWFLPIYLFIVERKRLIRIPWYKKLIAIFAWPTFDSIGRYTQYVALFIKAEWKPIPHDSQVTIDDLHKESDPIGNKNE